MEERLKKAAEEGNIDALYRLIEENPSLLDDIDKKPFVDSPLHISASAGQNHFAKEIMRLKPSFARKLNKDGFSPMHLALQREKIETVLQLLEDDRDLVCVQGREGITPLHHAAKTGNTCLLRIFLSACPKSIEYVTIRNETALHIALKSDKLEAFKLLAEWLREACDEDDHYKERLILHWKDEQGNTILHLAASKQRFVHLKVCINSKYPKGFRPDLYVGDGQHLSDVRVVMNMLCNVGEYGASPLPPIEYFGHYISTHQRLNKAAHLGDIDALYAIIWDDPHLLESIDKVPFIDTPLHLAVVAGHTRFAMEIMGLKPSFAKKPNRDGCSPMHLALQRGHAKVVRRLLDADRDLVLVKGRNGATPLHCVAGSENLHLLEETDILDLMTEFLAACPTSIKELTTHKETAVHVAAKWGSMKRLIVLIGWLEHTKQNNMLDWTDDEGNTVLHLVCQKKLLLWQDDYIVVIKLLVGAATSPAYARIFPILQMLCPWLVRMKVDLNIENSQGLTAMHMLELECPRNTRAARAMKRIGKWLKAPPFLTVTTIADFLGRNMSSFERWAIKRLLLKQFRNLERKSRQA